MTTSTNVRVLQGHAKRGEGSVVGKEAVPHKLTDNGVAPGEIVASTNIDT
jgi:hypothetical protein